MKYLYIIIGALFLVFIEAMVGSVSPLNYLAYLFVAGSIIVWLFEVRAGVVFVLVGAILLDLLLGNWVGTALVSLFLSLLILGISNSVFHLDSESRRPIGGALNLVLAIVFNHFLIILQDNGFRESSVNYLIYQLVVSLVVFVIAWTVLSSSVVKRTRLYR